MVEPFVEIAERSQTCNVLENLRSYRKVYFAKLELFARHEYAVLLQRANSESGI